MRSSRTNGRSSPPWTRRDPLPCSTKCKLVNPSGGSEKLDHVPRKPLPIWLKLVLGIAAVGLPVLAYASWALMDRTPPEIEISDAAASMIREALADAPPGVAVHLQIDGRWQHDLSLRPTEGHEIRAESGGIPVLMDVATAQRAGGLKLDVEEGLAGTQLKIDNPNVPPSG